MRASLEHIPRGSGRKKRPRECFFIGVISICRGYIGTNRGIVIGAGDADAAEEGEGVEREEPWTG